MTNLTVLMGVMKTQMYASILFVRPTDIDVIMTNVFCGVVFVMVQMTVQMDLMRPNRPAQFLVVVAILTSLDLSTLKKSLFWPVRRF